MTTMVAAPERMLWGRLRRYLPAAGMLVLGLVLWEAVVALFRIQGFLLPPPSEIARVYFQIQSVVWAAGWVTLREALGGFFIGSTLALLVALAAGRWGFVRKGAMPLAIIAGSAPIIALAPIMNSWFGSTNPLSKMAVVSVMVFFPVMLNAVRGLTQVDPDQLELLSSYASSPWQVMRKLRIPNALPYLFSAFKVAAALSLIGAIVSEYFGGPRRALGVFISQQAAGSRLAHAWSAILVGSIMGITFYLLIMLVERRAMPWHVSVRAAD
jgi:NitT/TauT family transport system permease protein